MTEFLNLHGLDGVDKILYPLILAMPLFVLATLIAIVVRLRRAAKSKRARLLAQSVDAQKSTTGLLISGPVQNAAANQPVGTGTPKCTRIVRNFAIA